MALIRFDEVTLAFGDQVILREAELAIEPNERVCLIGRNGAGKSTTLKLIAGELEPAAGTISLPPAARIGLVAQSVKKCHGVSSG